MSLLSKNLFFSSDKRDFCKIPKSNMNFKKQGTFFKKYFLNIGPPRNQVTIITIYSIIWNRRKRPCRAYLMDCITWNQFLLIFYSHFFHIRIFFFFFSLSPIELTHLRLVCDSFCRKQTLINLHPNPVGSYFIIHTPMYSEHKGFSFCNFRSTIKVG